MATASKAPNASKAPSASEKSDVDQRLKKGRRQRALKESLVGYAMISPWIIGFLLLTVGSMGYSFYLSFTSYNILSPPEWIGISNFERIFTGRDPRFWNSVRRTFMFAFTSVPLRLTVALCVALIFKKQRKGTTLFTTLYYVPSIIGGSVAVAIIWRQLFSFDGVFNSFLGLFGIDPYPWLVSTSTAIWMLVLLGLWQFGAPMIIFLAGLRQIPQELYEAASIDGAGSLRQFRNITLPMLSPVIFFNLVMALIGGFQVFSSAFLITGGGPRESTFFYALHIYHQAFSYNRMGYASALGWVLLVIIVCITALVFAGQKYWVHYSGE